MQESLTYKQLQAIFAQYFSLGNLNVDINNKFALISLICCIVHSMKKKNPDVSYYETVYKICAQSGMTEDFMKGLAVMCESFGYGCTTFPTFNIQPKDMVQTCRYILKTYLPF